ncbi:pectate lyase-like [Salvia miltiorrhiza]|uniref:pectate lyase-like n=1 Tax=Salvia miltiorrhiza TaxID=226208 RepID=UPI0025ACBB15|nr:pectate lyase-like [Salvia miltiorrhiza]
MASINSKTSTILLGLLCLVAVLPKSNAGIAEMDDYLKKKAEQSHEEYVNAYVPNPEAVADEISKEVGETMEKQITKRRHLKEDGNMATNPIDRCWRGDKNWADNRKRLADCVLGFGRHTTGGKDGKFYAVTDNSDDDVDNPRPGTLRHAVIQEEPLWIIFDHNMVIRLKEELIFASDKTIDGRGANVRIAYGAGLTLQFVHNIIIHNIRIHNIVPAHGGLIRDAVDHIGLRTMSDGDAISIFGSNNIWIDHVSLSKATDGLIDAIEGSTAITISNCKFNNHNAVMLLGAHDSSTQDKLMQATVAFNRFGEGLVQRMPRCRWGFFHIINNYYSHWQMYAIGGSAGPTIISQGNRYKASDNSNTKQVTKREYTLKEEWMKWQWQSEGDVFVNGAYFTDSGPKIKHSHWSASIKEHIMKFRPGSYAGRLSRYAGALKCVAGKLC